MDKFELPFDEIEVTKDELILRLSGRPMYRWPLPPLGRGDSVSLAGVKGSIDLTISTDSGDERA